MQIGSVSRNNLAGSGQLYIKPCIQKLKTQFFLPILLSSFDKIDSPFCLQNCSFPLPGFGCPFCSNFAEQILSRPIQSRPMMITRAPTSALLIQLTLVIALCQSCVPDIREGSQDAYYMSMTKNFSAVNIIHYIAQCHAKSRLACSESGNLGMHMHELVMCHVARMT